MSTKKRRTPKRGYYWLLAVVLIGALGWIGWAYWTKSKDGSATLPGVELVRDWTGSGASVEPQGAERVGAERNPPAPSPKEPARESALTQPAPTDRSVDETAGRPPRDIYEVQVALARERISPGPIDGIQGSQTRKALAVFQKQAGLPATGAWDGPVRERLKISDPVEETLTVTAVDLGRLRNIPSTWLGKSELDYLGYESALEMAAEQGHAYESFIRRLNPGMSWTNVADGARVRIPRVDYPPFERPVGSLRISLSARTLQILDEAGRVLAHFPCSIATRVEKRPVGQLFVETLAADPNYTFDPENFPESAEGRRIGRPLVIPPGPNCPVGVAWIGLNRPGYGIHGTPEPENVGRTTSHGCFRLANWDAAFLAGRVAKGTPVIVEP